MIWYFLKINDLDTIEIRLFYWINDYRVNFLGSYFVQVYKILILEANSFSNEFYFKLGVILKIT